jgi:ATP-dependent helicase/nuclease subunit A
MIRDAASQRQVDAANPAASTWLAANAGSGKTSVLTDRVARLLLNHVDPTSILCLTYTKAAAFEMQNRLFRRLGEWAMLDDAPLGQRLADLGLDREMRPDDLRSARRLFARAIETPGGLRIQTIHSFCAGLLRRFPLEAGVSPQFTEMEDRAASLLRDEIVEDMADGPDRDAVAGLAMLASGDDLPRLVAEIADNRTAFQPAMTAAACWQAFGLPPGFSEQDCLGIVFDGSEAALLSQAVPVLARQSATMQTLAASLAQINLVDPGLVDLETLFSAFLYKTKEIFRAEAKTASIPTKKAVEAMGDDLSQSFHALMRRVASAKEAQYALRAAERTLLLHCFAGRFLPEYAARKAARGALDFDDLITGARALLTDPAVAQWVLYRLDGGIDHILVDEAQDTSPLQWEVIDLLAQEILDNPGDPANPRTIFVVGDVKQSIYSFQGANVEDFSRMKAHFGGRLAQGATLLADLTLEHSFRSSPIILDVVDAALGAEGTAMGGTFRHEAFRYDMPGRVEVWPPFLPEKRPEPGDWTETVDHLSPDHHSTLLAEKVARRIKCILDANTSIPGKTGPRRATPGDILILVRSRSDLFAAIIRACKAAGLPIAGADRLKLGAELAVKDLGSLLAFLATPEDDLSLAEVLRSPLFGWTEHQLYVLAQGRSGYLWEALRGQAEQYPEVMEVLSDLRNQTDFLRPYDLVERALSRHRGRERLLERLGAEAEDGIDALLSQALAYERGAVPSLTGFLSWLQTEDVEIKRQLGSAGNLIRVMTVHGAKGLEAPIVILPDTADPVRQDRGKLIRLMSGLIIWKPSKDESPAIVTQARQARIDAADRESLRLMYVAMTRAQSWLMVGAAGALKSHGSQATEGEETEGLAWYDRIKAGVLQLGPTVTPEGGYDLRFGNWPEPVTAPNRDHGQPLPPLPDFVTRHAPPTGPRITPVSPSNLGGAKVLPGEAGEDNELALRRGTGLHLLLEHLAGYDAALWPALAEALIADESDRAICLADATRVMMTPALAPLFGPGTLAEVGLTCDLDGVPMLGNIDRLIVGADHVLAVDFKSNQIVPQTPAEVPEGLVRQLAAYAKGLRQIYPDRKVKVAILWTKTASLMPLPDL